MKHDTEVNVNVKLQKEKKVDAELIDPEKFLEVNQDETILSLLIQMHQQDNLNSLSNQVSILHTTSRLQNEMTTLTNNPIINSEFVSSDIHNMLNKINTENLSMVSLEKLHITVAIFTVKTPTKACVNTAKDALRQIMARYRGTKTNTAVRITSFKNFPNKENKPPTLVLELKSKAMLKLQKILKKEIKLTNMANITKYTLPKLHVTIKKPGCSTTWMIEKEMSQSNFFSIPLDITLDQHSELTLALATARTRFQKHWEIDLLSNEFLIEESFKTDQEIDSSPLIIKNIELDLFESNNPIAIVTSKDLSYEYGVNRQVLNHYPNIRKGYQGQTIGEVFTHDTSHTPNPNEGEMPKNAFIFNLIYKKSCSDRPHITIIERTLIALRKEMKERGISTISMPEISQGYDRIRTNTLRKILQKVFANTGYTMYIHHRAKKISTSTESITDPEDAMDSITKSSQHNENQDEKESILTLKSDPSDFKDEEDTSKLLKTSNTNIDALETSSHKVKVDNASVISDTQVTTISTTETALLGETVDINYESGVQDHRSEPKDETFDELLNSVSQLSTPCTTSLNTNES